MFLKLLFRKYGLKENKYLMATIYGLIYFVLTFLIFLFSTVWIEGSMIKYLYFSIAIGAVMSLVYLIKWEAIKL